MSCAAALVLDRSIPVKTEALERSQDLIGAAANDPLVVKVFHPDQPAAAVVACIEKASGGGKQRAEVQ
jgi:hypothetical protein